jgi:hypothetical protein
MMRDAPWTKDEVISLMDFQEAGHFHEFTCVRRDDGNHAGSGALVPTVRGWICQFCDYTQDWAHDFMLNGSHREASKAIIEQLHGKPRTK